MDEKLMTEIFSEKQEVPEKLKEQIHKELLKQEKAIMVWNIAITLTAVFIVSFFVISFTVIFIWDIISLLLVSAFSVASALTATALAVTAGKYEIRNIQKGLS